MKASPLLFITLPLIGDKGYLSRILRNRVPFIPRVGESLYIAPELDSKVASVNYSGINYNWIRITLEPIPLSFKDELTKESNISWAYYVPSAPASK